MRVQCNCPTGPSPSGEHYYNCNVRIEGLETQLSEARSVMRLVEWAPCQYPAYEPQCPACGGYRPVLPGDPQFRPGILVGHAPDCRLDKAITS